MITTLRKLVLAFVLIHASFAYTYAQTPAAPDSALNFNGTNQYVNFSTGGTVVSGNFTVEAWVNPASLATSGPTIFSSRVSADNSFDMTLVGGGTGIHADIGNGTAWLTTSANASFTYVAGQWMHVAYAVSPTGYTIYINGNLVGSGAFSGTPVLIDATHTQFYIGSEGGFGQYFNGAIDEERVWNTTRTQAQIQANMYNVVSPTSPNLIAYYNFSSGTTSTTVPDLSPSGFTGTKINGPTEVESYAMVVPTALPATAISPTGFTANWSAPVIGTVTNYLLDVSTSPTFTSFVTGYNALNVGSIFTYNVTGLAVNTPYYYRVRADKASVTGQGANSSVVSAIFSPGAALNFNGTNNYVSVPTNSSFAIGLNNFTIEADIQTSVSQANYTGIVANSSSGSNNGFQLVLYNNNIACEFSDGSTLIGVANGLQGTTLLNDGNWHHVAAVLNRSTSTIQLLVDGNVEATYTNASISNMNASATQPLLIGTERTKASFFNGNIDEVRVWSRALCAGELQNYKSCEILTSGQGLACNFHFNEGYAAGTNSAVLSLLDSGAYTNNGTLNNFTLSGSTSNWVSPGGVATGTNCSVYALPAAPTTTSASRIGTGTVMLTASASSNWYAFANGGVSLGSGISFTTPSISATTTYYAETNSGGCVSSTRTPAIATVTPVSAFSTTISPNSLCVSGSAIVTLANSQLNTTYTLRNNSTGALIGCPVTGTGSALTFNTGTVTGSTTYNVLAHSISNGGPGSGLSFNGSNAYVNVTGATNIPVGNSSYTIEAWIKPAAFNNAGIAGWGNYGTTGQVNSFRLSFNKGGSLENSWGGTDLIVAAPTLTDGSWHHVAVAYDGTTRTMYLDGTSIGSDVPGTLAVPNASNLTIGSTNNLTEWFNGSMDEVRIWNVARTQAQISTSMTACLFGNETGLEADYKMEEGSGTILSDASCNANNGSLSGTTLPAWVAGTSNTCSGNPSLQMTTLNTLAINPAITNQTVTAAASILCPNTSTNITTGASQTGDLYFLQNNANDSVIGKAVSGTGAALTLPTGNLAATTTFNVTAQSQTTGISFTGATATERIVVDTSGGKLTNLGGGITMEAWVYPTNISATRSIIRKSRDYNIYLSAGKVKVDVFPIAGSTYKTLTGTTTLTINTWTHVAATYDGTTIKIYVNGVLNASGAGTNLASPIASTLWIGNIPPSGAGSVYFLGTLDEVRIWNTVNTAKQINTNMTACLTGTEPGLVLDYKFEDGTGNTTCRNTATGHNGTLTNFTSPTTSWVAGAATCGGCSLQMTTTPTVNVSNVFAITSNPTNQTICTGTNTSFAVTVTGVGLAYQWQVSTDGGTTYSNIANGSVYSNVTSATLTLTNTPVSLNSYLYQCVVSASCGGPATSTAATLTVNAGPVSPLISGVFDICAGGSATLTAASATTYSWSPGGATTASITVSPAATTTYTLTAGIGSCIATTTQTVNIRSNKASLNFNGSNNYIPIGNAITNVTGYTKEAWIYANASGSCNIISSANSPFWLAGNYISAAHHWGGGAVTISDPTVFPLNTWTHIAVTYDLASTTLTLYRNGIAVATNTTIPTYFVEPIQLGAFQASNFFQGNLDEVRLWNYARTQAQIAANMNQTLTGTQPGLVAYYDFDQGVPNGNNTSLTSLPDLSGSGNTGTLTNFALTGTSSNYVADYQNPTITGTPNACLSGSTTLTVSGIGAATYSWNPGGATTASASLSPTSVTNYTATTTDISGCSATATQVVTINASPAITVQAANTVTCAGSLATFSVTASGPGLTYLWQENQGSGFNTISNGGIYSGATTNTLTLTGVTAGMNNYTYQCIVSGTCTPAVTGTAATLTVNGTPSIKTQATNATVCAGSNASFAIITNGSGSTYQWQENQGSGFNNISNGGIYSGCTTSTLVLTGVTNAMNGYTYQCVVSQTCAAPLTGTAATLTVVPLPAITSQAVNTSVCSGGNASFSVTTSGAGLTYQWQVSTGGPYSNILNGGVYSNATTATLNITGAGIAMNGYSYECIVTGTCTPAVTGTAAVLTVNSLPAISVQATNANGCSGTNATFSIQASGTAITYQWQENQGSGFNNITNGGIYGGATTNMLSLTGVTNAMNTYSYQCVVSGTCTPAVTGVPATLTINSPATISVQANNATVCSGSNATFSVTAGGTGVSYLWQENRGSGFTNLTNAGIYSGCETNTLTLTGVTTGMNGYTYQCVVSSPCLNYVTGTAATLNVNTPPAITVQAANSTICAGANTSFSVTAAGSGLTYQWQVSTGGAFSNVSNTGVYTNATTSTLNITGATVAMNGNQYQCIVSGTCTPAVTGTAATLNINTLPAISVQASNAAVCPGSNATFSITASGTAITYQWQENKGSGFNNLSDGGVYSGSTTNSLILTGVGAGMNGYTYQCVVSGTCSPTATGTAVTLTINALPVVTVNPSNSAICAGNNTSFSTTATGAGLTYQWMISTDGGTTYNNLTNTGIYTNATTSTLNLTGATAAVNGYMYECVVSGTCTPGATTTAATLTINAAPAITVNPSNSTICSGNNTSFSVTATGAGLAYQWKISTDGGTTYNNLTNTGIYSNATTSTLNLTGATTAVNGDMYECVVSGTCTPGATTTAATLTINAAPAVTVNPSNSTICSGNNTSFSVTATGVGLTYQWKISTDGGTTYNNLTNTGIYSNATTSTLNLTGATSAVNGDMYECVVSGTCTPGATTTAATLTINAAPAVTVNPSNSTICSGNNTSFSVTATGVGLTYQWKISTDGGTTYNNLTNTGIYSNATTSTLNLTGATSAANGDMYECVVSGTCTPGATTTAATLTINTAPAVTVNPSNSTICSGNNTSFSVTATGAGLAYQWKISTDGGTTYNNLTNTGIYTNVTTATLNLTGATSAVNGDMYECVVSGTCASSATTTAATLTINAAPVVTVNPSNSTICSGTNTSFSVTATGTGLTYQWQVSTNGGTTYTNLSNTGIYTNVTASTLNVTGATVAVNGYMYVCVVSGTCTPGASSSPATLHISAITSITSNPSNSTICSGTNTSFSATATGAGLTYQWEVSTDGGTTYNNLTNAGIYSNVTASTLNLTGATAAVNGYMYECVISSTCASNVTTTAAMLAINTAPVVTVNPVNSAICSGNNTSFGVTATGTGLTYQWKISTDGGTTYNNLTNTGIYTNVTTSTLNLTGATSAVNGDLYECVVSGTCTPVASSTAATLTINAAPVVTVGPANSTICAGTNTSFSVTASGAVLTYQWKVSTDGGTTYNNLTNTGIYTNVTTSTLNLTSATAAVNGNMYECVVSGTCTPAAISSPATLNINASPVVTVNPSNSSICSGGNTSFSVTATGLGLTYQWQESTDGGITYTNLTNAGIYTNVTASTLNLTGATASVNGNWYECLVSGTCAPASSSTGAILHIKLPTTGDTTASACSSFIWYGTTYTATGTSTHLLTNKAGCDSTVTLHLSILQPTSGDTTVTACTSFMWYGTSYTITGAPTHHLTNKAGCDSTVTLHLTINQPNTGDTSATACSSFTWYGTAYTATGTPTHLLTNKAGCDSTVTLHLTIKHTSSGDTTATACSSFVWYGTTYASTGTPTHLLVNKAGCDSTVTLHLTIKQPTTGDTTATACSSFAWYGTTYTSNGTPTHLLTNKAGCDSVVTLHLIINQPTTGDTTVSACTSFVWYGTTYTSNGTPTHLLLNKAGCDSTVTLHLTIKQPTSGDTTATACSSFTWYGTAYSATGTPTHLLTNKAGCDSTVTLHLTIKQPSAGDTTATANGSFVWYGITYTNTGTPTHLLTNQAGCDSVVTLHLTIIPNHPVSISISANATAVCAGTPVTFTASPTNGGTAPAYQWQVNGVNVGTDTSSYTSAALHANDAVTCILTSNATSTSGNPATSNIIVMTVNTPPVITCLANQTAKVPANSCTALVNYGAPAITGSPAATTTYAFTGATTGSGSGTGSGMVFNKGITTVSLTATNTCGTSNCSFTVTIKDTINPTITAPASLNVVANNGCTATGIVLGTPVTADNCTVAAISNNAPAAFSVGSTVVTWTVTDGSGNTATATQTVLVRDTTHPTITAPASVSATTNNGCSAVNVFLGVPTTADNCTVSAVSNNAPASFPLGTTTVIWTVADAGGNTTTATQTVTVKDNVSPVITGMPANMTVYTSTACTAPATWTAPIASDNCTMSSFTSTMNSGQSFPQGVNTVTYTATDASGNTATGFFTVTVLDTSKPVFTSVPANITSGSCHNNVSYATPVATDNCTVSVSLLSGLPSGATFPVGVTTIRYTATDASGNVRQCSFTVTVNPAPTASLTLHPDTICAHMATYAVTGGMPAGGVYSGPGVTNGMFTADAAGTSTPLITYTLTDAFGCQAVTWEELVIQNCTGIEESFMKPEIVLFPNPASGSVTIRISELQGKTSFFLYDALGQVIREVQLTEPETVIDRSQIPNGAYLYRIMNAKGQVGSGKLIFMN